MDGIYLKGKKKNSLYPKILIFGLVVLVILLSRASWNVFLKEKNTKESLVETQEDFQNLEREKNELEGDINNLSTARGVDEEIRNKFRVTKDGEGMIMLIDSPEISTTTTEENKESFWSRLFDFF